jgi:hypothetical protein
MNPKTKNILWTRDRTPELKLLHSGHWSEFLGVSQPRFDFRPLWIDCDVPSWLTSRDVGFFSRLSDQILEFGFNALILGGLNSLLNNPMALLKPQIQILLKFLNEKKIQLALNLSGLCQSSEIKDLKVIHGIHLIAVTSRVREDSLESRDGKTYIDRVIEDIHQFEALTRGQFGLIYYLPYNRALMENKPNFLQEISLGISPTTILSFSCVSGCPSHVYLRPHSFWRELCYMQEVLGVRLLPIVRVAEPQWPSIRYDIYETYFSRCLRHKYAGIAAYTSTLPIQGEFNHCNLWVAGQMQWGSLPPILCVETWFKAFHPEWDYTELESVLKQIRGYVLDAQAYTSHTTYAPEELRCIHDSMAANFKVIKMKIEKIQSPLGQHSKENQIFLELNNFLKEAESIL